jgi:hypothetical protein
MVTRWRAGPAWGLLVGFVAVPVQAGERKEFPLKYRLSLQTVQEVGAGGQTLALTSDKPVLKEEPTYRSREPLYAALELGAKNESFTLVLDSAAGADRGYDTL